MRGRQAFQSLKSWAVESGFSNTDQQPHHSDAFVRTQGQVLIASPRSNASSGLRFPACRYSDDRDPSIVVRLLNSS